MSIKIKNSDVLFSTVFKLLNQIQVKSINNLDSFEVRSFS